MALVRRWGVARYASSVVNAITRSVSVGLVSHVFLSTYTSVGSMCMRLCAMCVLNFEVLLIDGLFPMRRRRRKREAKAV